MGDLPDSLGRGPTVHPLSAMIPKVDPALYGNGENGIMREIEQGRLLPFAAEQPIAFCGKLDSVRDITAKER